MVKNTWADGPSYSEVMRNGRKIQEESDNEHIAQVWEYDGRHYEMLWDRSTGENLVFREHFLGADDDDKPMSMLEVVFEFAQRAMLEAPGEGNRTETERKIYDALANFIRVMKDAGYEF